MLTDPLFYKLLLVIVVWLCLMLHVAWSSERAAVRLTPPQPVTPPRKCSAVPKPFAGFTQKPHCAAREPGIAPRLQAPSAPLPPIVATRGRPRQIDTSHPFCRHPDCPYYGWVGLGHISAKGHPGGGPWRQLYCSPCQEYVLETHGTIFHGQHLVVDLIVHVLGCLAEGLGIRGTAQVFEIDPHTVRRWLVEAAEQLQTFSRHFLCEMHGVPKRR